MSGSFVQELKRRTVCPTLVVMPDGNHLALIRGGHLHADLIMLERVLAGSR